ncbi:MAG: hypothetical protein PHE89_06555 [Alphaproteobacteria bacterium]|nr:hypothetical protein [Alphaproteobacteria bacterium]
MFIKSKPKAPMKAESYKRFSLYKKCEKRDIFEFFFDWLIKGFFVGIFISINFLLFASSANYSLFLEGFNVVPHIFLPVAIIFALSILIMFLISFSALLEDLFVSLVVSLMIYAMLNQYMTLSPDSFLYSIFYNLVSPEFAKNFITGSDVIAAVFAFIVTFVFLLFANKKLELYVTSLLVLIFAGIFADEYINQRHKKEFITVYENGQKLEQAQGNKFIYVMLPNATSHNYLSAVEDSEVASQAAKKTKDIMQGFYAKNNFSIYPNAYVEEKDPFLNIVSQFNILNSKPSEEAVLDNVMIDGYMKFKNRNEKHIYLEENELFDNFKHANYRINVYQSHGIELCHKNNQELADKCVEKISRPFNFNGMNISECQKSKLLILQWIDSTKLFSNLSWLYGFLGNFTDPNKVALVGIPYDNLYVINSVRTFDVIFDDILKDTGNATYFTLIDAPGEMFVYDEYCAIKPTTEWLSKKNLPWVKKLDPYYKKVAYLNQMNCVYGKLQEFIDKLEAFGLDKNTVIVVQGISGLDDKDDTYSLYDRIRSEKAVTMAIKDPKQSSYNVNYGFCPVSSFLINYLYSKKVCNQSILKNAGSALKYELSTKLAKTIISPQEMEDSKNQFNLWYIEWLRNNSKIDDVAKMQQKQKEFAEKMAQVKAVETIEEKVVQEAIPETQAPALSEKAEKISEAPVEEIEEDGFVDEVVNDEVDVVEEPKKENVKQIINKAVVEDDGGEILLDIEHLL